MSNTWNRLYQKGKRFSVVNEFYLDELLGAVRAFRGGRQPRRALDLGCGTGDLAIKLARRSITVDGVDFSRVAIAAAQRAAATAKVSSRVCFFEHDLERLHRFVAGRPYDLVITRLTIAFIKRKARFLKAAHRPLGRHGVCVVITPVLLKGVRYGRRLRNISVPKDALEALLRKEFGNFKIHHRRYFEDFGLELTYLSRR